MFCWAQTPQQIQNLFDQKNYQEAQELIQKVLQEDPSNSTWIELLGDVYSHQKQFENAKKQYKTLVQKVPNSATYHYKYGAVLGLIAKDASKFRALRISGDIAKHLKKAASLDSQHIDVRWALVELYVHLPGIVGGGKKKALKYAQQLEIISPIDGYIAKGYIYENKDDPMKAEMYYRMAIDHEDSPEYFHQRSSFTKTPQFQRNALYYQIGKIAAEYNVKLMKGEQCLLTYIKNHTIKDGIPLEWAYLRLAQIYRHKHNKEKALFWITKATNLRADFKPAFQEKKAIDHI
jgi:tetratricopeptide (TPR) repeat protein